jgi:hypothetical protein
MKSTYTIVNSFSSLLYIPLLNYTTAINAFKTTMEIATLLSKAGANAILRVYDKEEGYVRSISLRILCKN